VVGTIGVGLFAPVVAGAIVALSSASNELNNQKDKAIDEARRALPEIREAPLSSVPSLVQHGPRDFDVFISHASEDKDAVVRPLANAHRDRGLKVWYERI
jgi:hypothetical protein